MRIAGVNIPTKKCIPFALTYIYGIGIATANKICCICKVDKNKRVSHLQDKDIENINSFIRQNYSVEGELRKEVAMNVKFLVEMGCYRGIRHRRSLPVRGQRTHTNAKTIRKSKLYSTSERR